MRGAGRRDWQLMRMAQAVAYSHAQLTGAAFHQPRKMPSFDRAFPDRRDGEVQRQTPDQALAAMKSWTAALAAYQNQQARRRPQ